MDKKTYTVSDILKEVQKGMSDFQIKNFVINSQLTPLKQLHQAALEAEIREENIRKGEFEKTKTELKIKIFEERLSLEENPLLKAEIELEIHLLKEKLIMLAREQDRMSYELKSFYEVITFFNENYDIGEMIEMKDTLEVDYWVKRLSKQAALDVVSTGRISNGNLSAMMDMPDEIFNVCLKETYALTSQLAKVVPMPMIGADNNEEFLLKFGPGEQNAIDQS